MNFFAIEIRRIEFGVRGERLERLERAMNDSDVFHETLSLLNQTSVRMRINDSLLPGKRLETRVALGG